MAAAALVVSLSPGQEDPAAPEDTAISDSVEALYCAIQRGRADRPELHQVPDVFWRSRAWSCAANSSNHIDAVAQISMGVFAHLAQDLRQR